MSDQFPLATLKRNFVSKAEGSRLNTSVDIPDSDIMIWLAEAYREINRRCSLLTARHSGDITAAVAQYTGPTDILDRLTFGGDRALSVRTSSTARSNPSLIDWRAVNDLYDLANLSEIVPVARPASWAWDERASGKLLILPPPNATYSGGLVLDYVQDPGPFSRLVDDEDLTVAVTNGDATWTFSAAITGSIAVDDLVGVRTTGELPTRWYRVSDISADPAVEMTEVYAGTTNAAALYVASQISPIEYRRPGLCAFAPVDWALATYFQIESGAEAAAPYLAMFEREIERIQRIAWRRPGQTLQGQNAAGSHPGFLARR